MHKWWREWGSPTESMALFSSKRSKITVPWWFSTWHSVVHSLSLGISQLLVLFLINRELWCVFPGPWCGSGHITACCTPAVCIGSLGSPCTLSLHTGRVAPLGHRTSMRGKNELPWELRHQSGTVRINYVSETSQQVQRELNIKILLYWELLFYLSCLKKKDDLSDKNEAENVTF